MKKKKQEWKYVRGGVLLSGLIGSKGFKTKQCGTISELIALACSVFHIDATDLHSALCQIRDIQAVQAGKPNVIPFTREPMQPSQRAIADFYTSWEWKRLRYDFLKAKQRKCECCGTSAEDGVRIVVDHVKPIRTFWNLRLDAGNLQILCNDCNMGKGSRDHTDWRTQHASGQ